METTTLKAHTIIWSRLTDELLTKFGTKDSIRAATFAINEELRSWGARTTDALVIADESVMCPDNEKGIVIVSELVPWQARVAFNQDGENRSAADRLTCALAILGAHYHLTDDAGQELLRQAQRVITDILLAHPVLLHPRLVIPFRTHGSNKFGQIKHVSVMAALLMTGIGQLPSVHHGIDETKAITFANTALINAPIEQKIPKMAFAPNSVINHRIRLNNPGYPMRLTGGMDCPFGAKTLASILEIAKLRKKDDSWIRLIANQTETSMVPLILRALLPNSGLQKNDREPKPGRLCEQLIKEVTESGILSIPWVQDDFRGHLQVGILHSNGHAPSIADINLPTWVIRENTTLAIEMLEKVGLAKNKLEAAGWLYLQLLGGGTNKDIKVSWAEVPHAMGFLESLADTGMNIPMSPPTNGDLMKAGVSSEYWTTLEANFLNWKTAHEIISRKQAMEGVFAAAAVDSPTTGDVQPSRRARSMRI